MDHPLPDLPVRASDADIFIAPAEAPHGMTLEMRQGDHGIIIQEVLSHRHMVKPFSSGNRKVCRSFRIRDVHRAECPPVDLQRFQMLLGGIPVTFIVCVRFNDRRFRQLGPDQVLHP